MINNSTGGWTAPAVTARTQVPRTGSEREQLTAMLAFYRETILRKCEGLTAEQLKTAPIPTSTLTLLGLVRHLAECERWWFRSNAAGQGPSDLFCTDEFEDGDFDLVAEADAEADLATFRDECDLADEAIAHLDLDHTFAPVFKPDTKISLRWVYLHMIDEYSRHCGHADVIRESIDGVTGY
ncbi:DinB family protein [Longispora albida]|uniref:DinB family protein n=1 Tax=Longispora albida TaxID=203523 RepID=UPI00058C17D5|nr:DinB family protein [Longispora albida]